MRVLISSNPVNLKAADPQVTVEAEYGDLVVEGSVATFAHHGPRSDHPVPCVDARLLEVVKTLRAGDPWVEPVKFGLSHFDLDTLGALMVLMGYREDLETDSGFWNLAAKADMGPHRLDREDPDHPFIAAYWAWSEEHRVYAPRDGSVLEITKEVDEAALVIADILCGDPDKVEDGRVFLANENALNGASFRGVKDSVIGRVSDQFTNHLYAVPDGTVFKAVVALNTAQKSVTVSLESPIDGISCRQVVQDLWGMEAGGHEGIAGSPRDREMTEADFEAALNAMAKVVPPMPFVPKG